MENIKFGPAGLGPVESAIKTLEEYHKVGFRACEISFTYNIYIKEKDAKIIGKKAKELGIQLSIHAPYFINFNSETKEKQENSKKRILNCLEIGTFLGAKYVVFHPGFYGKDSKEKTYENIRKNILELQEIKKEKKYTPKLAPETMGKINVFGSIEEISQLVHDTKCSACIDFAHILARSGGDYRFEETLDKFKDLTDLHIHFSGIIYGDKGERKHKKTLKEEWEKLLKALPKNKEISIVNESPEMIEDSLEGIKVSKKSKK
ncbi:MAG TPA: TIM barrel protein [Nanoarchaeota archaeon]|nr:TIM barrel protein [Nanoarchaeota archaeon]